MESHVQFTLATVRQVKQWLPLAIRKACNGCQIDHPSQLQHQCVMLEDDEERVRFCLDKALDMVDWKAVRTDMLQHMRTALILVHPCCYDDEEWLRNVWCDEEKKDVLVTLLTYL